MTSTTRMRSVTSDIAEIVNNVVLPIQSGATDASTSGIAASYSEEYIEDVFGLLESMIEKNIPGSPVFQNIGKLNLANAKQNALLELQATRDGDENDFAKKVIEMRSSLDDIAKIQADPGFMLRSEAAHESMIRVAKTQEAIIAKLVNQTMAGFIPLAKPRRWVTQLVKINAMLSGDSEVSVTDIFGEDSGVEGELLTSLANIKSAFAGDAPKGGWADYVGMQFNDVAKPTVLEKQVATKAGEVVHAVPYDQVIQSMTSANRRFLGLLDNVRVREAGRLSLPTCELMSTVATSNAVLASNTSDDIANSLNVDMPDATLEGSLQFQYSSSNASMPAQAIDKALTFIILNWAGADLRFTDVEPLSRTGIERRFSVPILFHPLGRIIFRQMKHVWKAFVPKQEFKFEFFGHLASYYTRRSMRLPLLNTRTQLTTILTDDIAEMLKVLTEASASTDLADPAKAIEGAFSRMMSYKRSGMTYFPDIDAELSTSVTTFAASTKRAVTVKVVKPVAIIDLPVAAGRGFAEAALLRDLNGFEAVYDSSRIGEVATLYNSVVGTVEAKAYDFSISFDPQSGIAEALQDFGNSRFLTSATKKSRLMASQVYTGSRFAHDEDYPVQVVENIKHDGFALPGFVFGTYETTTFGAPLRTFSYGIYTGADADKAEGILKFMTDRIHLLTNDITDRYAYNPINIANVQDIVISLEEVNDKYSRRYSDYEDNFESVVVSPDNLLTMMMAPFGSSVMKGLFTTQEVQKLRRSKLDVRKDAKSILESSIASMFERLDSIHTAEMMKFACRVAISSLSVDEQMELIANGKADVVSTIYKKIEAVLSKSLALPLRVAVGDIVIAEMKKRANA